MLAILITETKVQSTGGYPVTVSGIDPTDTDCICGRIDTPGTGPTDARWNLAGIMRGGTDQCNLQMNSVDLAPVAALARKLGAT